MPSKKRSSSENHDQEEDSLQRYSRGKQWRRERKAQEEEEEEVEDEEEEEDEDDDDDEEEEDDDEDSDGSDGDPEDLPEYVDVKLTDIRKDVQCPICLGIIKKTRTVMECLHRFCRECIDKSMRLGNNECPACRTHCASRRSLRDDPRFDAIIECLYPDIAKYEEEELAFHEEEKNRNKQIQDSIAQIFQRQSEALIKRRRKGKEPTTPKSRPTRNTQSPYSKRKRNGGGSDDNADEDETGNTTKDSCSTDEQEPQTKRRRYTRRTKSTNSDVAENEVADASKNVGNNMEGLAWGRGGARSNARHGSGGGGSKNTRSSTRLSKLADYLQSLQDINGDDEYVAHETSVQAEEEKEEEEEDGEKIQPVNEIPKVKEEEESNPAINNNDNTTPIPISNAVVSRCEAVAAQESLG